MNSKHSTNAPGAAEDRVTPIKLDTVPKKVDGAKKPITGGASMNHAMNVESPHHAPSEAENGAFSNIPIEPYGR